jgi:predicted nuclease of predicted toxin-antitoxin system
VKLLLDENLSRRIVPALATRFPGTSQVTLLNLERATDLALAEFASREGFVIVSKDDDFVSLVTLRGYAPKLIRIIMGNASNDQVLSALLSRATELETLLADPAIGIVELEA